MTKKYVALRGINECRELGKKINERRGFNDTSEADNLFFIPECMFIDSGQKYEVVKDLSVIESEGIMAYSIKSNVTGLTFLVPGEFIKELYVVRDEPEESSEPFELEDLSTEISDFIYTKLDHMYCDNCRYNSELTDGDINPCEECNRKENGWAISKGTCNYLANHIMSSIERRK